MASAALLEETGNSMKVLVGAICNQNHLRRQQPAEELPFTALS